MERENTKKFELNTSILKNFEQIMAMKLDEIEELKITDLDKGSKLLNIISLCANIKTLIIEGDQRINTDKILGTIFKPNKLENLILNNVRLPKPGSLKKYNHLKMISLNGIRLCNIKSFLSGIADSSSLEIINLTNSDLMNESIAILKNFSNLKYIKIEHVKNCKLEDLDFLEQNDKILKIDITNNEIPIVEVNHLLKCHCIKNIDLDLLNLDGKKIENSKLMIHEKDKRTLTITAENLENVAKQINFYKLDKINVVYKHKLDKNDFIKMLKKYKKEVQIMIQNFSCLTAQQAEKIRDTLKLEKISLINQASYPIEDYIEMRNEIQHMIDNVNQYTNELEKFLGLYQFIGQEFQVIQEDILDYKHKKCSRNQVSQILQNCLQCMNIECNVIFGEELENERTHSWNQVKLENKWYNVDLGLDMENIKRKKAEYCLLGDENFLETHTPKAGKNNYCAEDFNQKIVKVFFKTGLVKEKLMESYLEIVIEKIKKLFNFNKNQEILTLPSGNSEENNENK